MGFFRSILGIEKRIPYEAGIAFLKNVGVDPDKLSIPGFPSELEASYYRKSFVDLKATPVRDAGDCDSRELTVRVTGIYIAQAKDGRKVQGTWVPGEPMRQRIDALGKIEYF